jgi:hypothetical protein
MPAEETNTRMWDKLQRARGHATDGPTPVTVVEPPAPAPAAAAAPEVTPPAPAATTPARGPDGKFVAAAVVPPPAEQPPVVEQPPVAAPVETPPETVEIEIDGQKMQVTPEIADAFKTAEKVQVDNAKAAERAALRAEIVAEVQASLPPQKSKAELDAEAALAAAEAAAKALKKPDSTLMLSDPAEYDRQMDLYTEQRIKFAADRAKAEAKAETLAEVSKQQNVHRASQEEQIRAALRDDFYAKYPTLKASEKIVDGLLTAKFDETQRAFEKGEWKAPTTAKERDEVRAAAFADVAARGTREVLKIMQAGKQIAPPVAPPPNLVASAPTHAPAPKAPEPERKPEDKFRKGSLSAALAARKAAREGASA